MGGEEQTKWGGAGHSVPGGWMVKRVPTRPGPVIGALFGSMGREAMRG